MLAVTRTAVILSCLCMGIVCAQENRSRQDNQPARPAGIPVGTFDAEVATKYTVADGLPSNDVLAIALAPDGVAYAGTSKGLARFEKGRWSRVGDYSGPVPLLAARDDGVIALAAGMLIRFKDGTISEFTELPTAAREAESFHTIETGGPLLLGTSNGLFEPNDIGLLVPAKKLADLETDIRSVAVSTDGRRAVGGPQGLFVESTEGWQAIYPHDEKRSWAPRDVRAVAFDRQDRLWFASPQGVGVQTGDGWRLFTGQDGLPFDDFTTMAAGEEGVVWFGTTKGAIRFDGTTWEYRPAPRWLPDEHVRAIAVNDNGDAWFATSAGVGLIERRPTTFAEKAAFFEEEIDKYHRRTPYGYVLSVRLKEPGDKSE